MSRNHKVFPRPAQTGRSRAQTHEDSDAAKVTLITIGRIMYNVHFGGEFFYSNNAMGNVTRRQLPFQANFKWSSLLE